MQVADILVLRFWRTEDVADTAIYHYMFSSGNLDIYVPAPAANSAPVWNTNATTCICYACFQQNKHVYHFICMSCCSISVLPQRHPSVHLLCVATLKSFVWFQTKLVLNTVKTCEARLMATWTGIRLRSNVASRSYAIYGIDSNASSAVTEQNILSENIWFLLALCLLYQLKYL